MVSLSKHVSSSYSCGTCCPDSYYAGHAYPGSVDLDAGDTTTVDVTEELADCYGSRYEVPAAPQSISYDHDVILIGAEGSQLAIDSVDEGSTSVSLGWTSSTFWEIADDQCTGDSVDADASFQAQVRSPTLGGSGCGNITRGADGTFSLDHLSQNATVSTWRNETDYGTIPRFTDTSATSWSGKIIVFGIVKVKVNTQNKEFNLQCESHVQSRNWTWSPVNPNEVSSGLYTFTVPPNGSSDLIGISALQLSFTATAAEVPSGPDNGLKWVSGLTQSDGGTSTSYKYQLSAAINSQNDFYQHQCGNWNGSSGYISGSRLRSNNIEHEAGSTMGHYHNYIVSNAANNLGDAAEGYIGQLTDSVNMFQSALDFMLSSNVTTIGAAMSSENGVCNTSASYGPDCTFYGPSNYPPYDSCDFGGVKHEPLDINRIVRTLLGRRNRPAPILTRCY